MSPPTFEANARTLRTRSLLDFLQFLDLGRHFHTSDPRDKVFAMLGMPCFVKLRPALIADYKKSLVEVYQDVVELSLLHMPNLEFLSYVQHDSFIPD